MIDIETMIAATTGGMSAIAAMIEGITADMIVAMMTAGMSVIVAVTMIVGIRTNAFTRRQEAG